MTDLNDNSELKNKHPNDDLLGTTFNPVELE